MNNFVNKTNTSIKCLFLSLLLIGILCNPASALDQEIYREIKTFNEVLNMVEKNYVEEVSPKILIQGAIGGMMRSLDPHSGFMTADMYKELEIDTKGSFGGIGIEITILKDILTVVSPIEDTPAFNAGIKAGDQIIGIDGKSTKDISIMEAVKKLRGPKDTKVILTIMRENLSKPIDIVITRMIIKIISVKWKIYDENIGYIRLSAFHERTGDDLKKAIKEIDGKTHPLKGLILDIRTNPGGLLNQAVDVSDVFMKAGIIVSIKGRVKSADSLYTATDDGDEPTCPMVVLVNEGSASASEIVAGALQDSGRGIILGTKTFGKGSVQTVIPLEDGAALKLTTAKYFTPKGRSIQAEGIIPDIVVKYVKQPDEKELADNFIRERDLKGYIKPMREDEEKKEESLKKELDDLMSDNQLKSAVDILKIWNIFKKVT